MPTASLPAPVGGWNARDSLDQIPPTDAIELVNFFPQPGALYGRGGSLTQQTVAAAPLDTLAPFTSSTLTKLIGACNGHIYDLTTLTGATSLASGFANDQWQYSHFNDKMILVNGHDAPQLYDGSTVTASSISLPGVPTVTLSQSHGTLASATYAYRVTATYGSTETAPSTEVSIAIANLATPVISSVVANNSDPAGFFASPPSVFFKVTAYNAGGETLPSAEVSVSVVSGSATVTWGAVTGATGYKVYRSRATGTEALVADVGNVTTYTDYGSITPSGSPPVSNTTSGAVVLTWTASQNPSGYKVYGRTAAGELLMATLASNVTTWTDDGSVTPSGAMPSSDNTGKNLLAVANCKGRAIYIEYRKAGFWYAAAGAFQGNLNWFPLDFVFHRGGYCVNVVTWSRDNGDGVDDMTAFISSNGECLVYQGNDPSDSLAWSLVGRFNIGIPLSTRSHAKLASAEVLLTTDGFLTLDEAIANQRAQELQTFGGKIIRAANAAAAQYGSNFGWECLYYPRSTAFIVNVPIVAGGQTEQYVQNTNTGSWTRFTGWNARTFCVFNERLYFGTNDGKLVLADTNAADTAYGYGDDGVSVEKRAQTGWQRFNEPGMRAQVTAVTALTNSAYPQKAEVLVLSDFKSRPLGLLSDAGVVEQNPGTWDVSFWDQDYWADSPAIFDPTGPDARMARYSTSSLGYSLSLRFRYTNKRQQLVWYASTFLIKPAGA